LIYDGGDTIEFQHLLDGWAAGDEAARNQLLEVETSRTVGSFGLRDILADTERRVIAQALEHEDWNRTRAAKLLGISRRQLFDKIQQYRLQK
jgi:DNA-binding NtrC family response regulator